LLSKEIANVQLETSFTISSAGCGTTVLFSAEAFDDLSIIASFIVKEPPVELALLFLISLSLL